jgi:hypothetical protein
MKKLYPFLLVQILVVLGSQALSQTLLPPTNLLVDGHTLYATWDPPISILLNENFEGDSLPSGWIETSQGEGWDTATVAQMGFIRLPDHSRFMITNDGESTAGNTGCCDYLIMPELDLTGYPGYHLTFQSFYTGNYAQKAIVEMSTDNGLTWYHLDTISPYPAWKEIDIDLSSYSGAGGLSSVRFAFHADDQGLQASGWAVDDVSVSSDSLGVSYYMVFLDGAYVGNTLETHWQYWPSTVVFGQDYACCIGAMYANVGSSNLICQPFTAEYLPPPQNLAANVNNNNVVFTWSAPVSNAQLTGYNIYRDGVLLVQLLPTDTTYVYDCQNGEACIDVTARFDLTIFGLPGSFGESVKSHACGYVDSSLDFPLNERWDSGQFVTNHWTADPGWEIDGLAGNEAPSARFITPVTPGGYQSTLTTWYYDAKWLSECETGDFYSINLYFEFRLDDNTANGLDTLQVQLVTEDEVLVLKEFSNTGNSDWQYYQSNLTTKVAKHNFRIRFMAIGNSSGTPVKWYLDNIQLYAAISDFGLPLIVSAQRTGNPENDILIRWEPALLNQVNYLLDDNSFEDQAGLELAGDLWLGNEFPTSDAGVLQKASVFMTSSPGASAFYTIEIFDEGRNLVGTSAQFNPLFNEWTSVYLPDIPFDGPLFAMLHIQGSGLSDKLAIDTNGPNAPAGYSWTQNESGWEQLAEPGVFLIRVQALLEGDSKVNHVNSPNNELECDTIGYSIYRRAYSSYPPSWNNGTGELEWIACSPKEITQFLDRSLKNDMTNCYEYSVAVIYRNWEQPPTGSDWDCIYVGLPEIQEFGTIKASPNPADQWVLFDLNGEFSYCKVFSISGLEMEQRDLEGKKELTLITSHYSPGTYLVKLYRKEGYPISRKLMIQH